MTTLLYILSFIVGVSASILMWYATVVTFGWAVAVGLFFVPLIVSALATWYGMRRFANHID